MEYENIFPKIIRRNDSIYPKKEVIKNSLYVNDKNKFKNRINYSLKIFLSLKIIIYFYLLINSITINSKGLRKLDSYYSYITLTMTQKSTLFKS